MANYHVVNVSLLSLAIFTIFVNSSSMTIPKLFKILNSKIDSVKELLQDEIAVLQFQFQQEQLTRRENLEAGSGTCLTCKAKDEVIDKIKQDLSKVKERLDEKEQILGNNAEIADKSERLQEPKHISSQLMTALRAEKKSRLNLLSKIISNEGLIFALMHNVSNLNADVTLVKINSENFQTLYNTLDEKSRDLDAGFQALDQSVEMLRSNISDLRSSTDTLKMMLTTLTTTEESTAATLTTSTTTEESTAKTTGTTTEAPIMVTAITVGARVVRGRDWKWGDQDGGDGVGTVVGKGSSAGWTRVRWDNGIEYYYRVGANNAFDLYLHRP